MIAQSHRLAGGSLGTGVLAVAVGVLAGLAAAFGLSLVRPILIYLALGGLAILISSFMLREQKAYWLFLLAFSASLEIYKRTTEWLIDPRDILNQYGNSTISFDIYVADVVLLMLLVPWVADICLRRKTLYFPRFCYLFILYLSWAMIVLIATSLSIYASIFEWMRELLYFIGFVYLINNLTRRIDFRAIVLALFVGLVMHSGIVVVFFHLGKGTDTSLFGGLFREREHRAHELATTLHETQTGTGALIKRSAGAFGHPAEPAYYFDYILPLAAAFLVAMRWAWYRTLLAGVIAAGCAGLYFTFSRAGMVGLAAACVFLLPIACWTRLISRQTFVSAVLGFAALAVVASPLALRFFDTRPEATSARIDMYSAVVDRFWQEPTLPLFGTGLNNSLLVIDSLIDELTVGKHTTGEHQAIHDFYLEVLSDVGVVGFLLFFGFFGRIVALGLQTAGKADDEMRALLVGMTAALLGIAVFNLADTFLYHVCNAMLWLYAGVIVAANRFAQIEGVLPERRVGANIAPGTAVSYRSAASVLPARNLR